MKMAYDINSYSFQQNNMINRKNQAILNMTRSIIKIKKKLPKEFWIEAMTYII